jgi:hypothetical protein
MLTLNSFNERKIYGICQGYNIDIGIERLPYRCTWSMLLAHSFGRVRVTHLLLLFCVLFSVSQCYWLFLSPFFLLRLCSFKNWLLILDVTLTVVTLDFTFIQTTTKKNRYANVMDTTITKNDNSNIFPHFSNEHVSFLSECCLLCSIKEECLVNDLPQVEQRYGTECVLDLCLRYSVLNRLEQILQICSALCIFICRLRDDLVL